MAQGAAGGQAWPAKPIKSLVPYPAPTGVPADIVNRMSVEVGKAVASPDITKRFESLGIEPVGNSPQQAVKFLDDEIAKWRKMITAAGVKAE